MQEEYFIDENREVVLRANMYAHRDKKKLAEAETLLGKRTATQAELPAQLEETMTTRSRASSANKKEKMWEEQIKKN